MMKNKWGYKQKDHSESVHRHRAYHHIYLKNREKYPLPFSAYEVHHKDGNKNNNRMDNLAVLTPEEHDKEHDKGNNQVFEGKIKRRIKYEIKILIGLSIISLFFLYMILSTNFWEKSIGYFFFLLLFMYFTLKTLWDILKWKRILKKGIEKLTSKDLKLMEKYINWDT